MVTIQPTNIDDAVALAACVDAVARERRWLNITHAFPPEATRAFVAGLQQGGGVHLSAKDGDLVVGWCDLIPGAFEGLGHTARLGMGLRAEYRGHGHGRALFEATIAAGRAKGFEKIELEVFASNTAAIRLYERQGFRPEGRRERARKLDGRYEDILLYGLFLA